MSRSSTTSRPSLPPSLPVLENTDLDENVDDGADIFLEVTLPNIELANFLLEKYTVPYGANRIHFEEEHAEEEQTEEDSNSILQNEDSQRGPGACATP